MLELIKQLLAWKFTGQRGRVTTNILNLLLQLSDGGLIVRDKGFKMLCALGRKIFDLEAFWRPFLCGETRLVEKKGRFDVIHCSQR